VRVLLFLQALVGSERRADSERGAAVVEYALLVALIALVVIGAITLFGQALADFFTSLIDRLPG
jgi:pilus assembly protein Flp/PilA